VAEKAKRIIAMVNEEKQIDEKIVLAPCDYKEMFKQTIKNRELEVVKYFSSINNMTQSLMTMILNNFLKAGAHVDFEEFYQQILTTLQIEKLAAELLIKELFIWSVQYHFNEYAILLINQKASSKNLGVFSEWTSVLGAFSDVPLFQAGDILENKQFLKNLCTENVIPIITTLAKNQRDDLLAAISMMQNDYEIALKYVIEKWDINSFLVLIKHPYYANIKMEGYETLLISANIHHCRMFEILLDHPNSKTIPMVIRAMLCDLSQGNKKITMHFKNLLLEEKKINPAEFSNLITTLIEWAMRLDHSTTYPNFLLNQLEKISKDAQEKISSIALNNNFQLFRRAKKFITLNGVSPFDSPTPKTERCDHMLKQLPSP
jgi:hypothetical protein